MGKPNSEGATMKVKDMDTKESRMNQATRDVWLDDVWLDEKSLGDLAKRDRLAPVLVRCGGGRFTCPAQDAKHFIQIITEHKEDYVRDVSRWSDELIVPHSANCEGN
jgi:hypothetical protein